MKSIELSNGRSWKSQKAALEHFKAMLGRYADNETVEDAVDHDDLLAVLERYDAAIMDGPPKIGCGVDLFVRRRNAGEGYSTPGFWVRRTDGSETDFSYISAVKGQPKSQAQELYDACRASVAADLVVAKKRHFKEHGDADRRVPCDISGKLIAIDEAHLDHAYPSFGHLVVTFRAARGWQRDVPPGVLTKPADGQTFTTFIDPMIAGAFRDFHHQAATMRIIEGKANLAMAARQRRPKVRLPVQLAV
ncbi:DCL family protein [Sphingomonas sp. CBMAI 2297]|uniref:DCL family protein n=1 Tax=Sphingomonas sp. CBMAI 2297 TaxID=2991720 RepID=UPI0024541FA2|nr:DCL family protein [Sphingomonas sp. CBMAI 2297]MDH4745871.1 DCL family protein [Sphingomonas sp. CBMAI 2297]